MVIWLKGAASVETAYSWWSEGFWGVLLSIKHVTVGSEAPCALECFCGGSGLGQVLVGYWNQPMFSCSCLGCGTAPDVHIPAFLEVPSRTTLVIYAREGASYVLGWILLTTLRRLISEDAGPRACCVSSVKQLLALFSFTVRWARILPHTLQFFVLRKECQCIWSRVLPPCLAHLFHWC